MSDRLFDNTICPTPPGHLDNGTKKGGSMHEVKDDDFKEYVKQQFSALADNICYMMKTLNFTVQRCYVRFVTQIKITKINNAKTKLKESRVRIHSIVKDYSQLNTSNFWIFQRLRFRDYTLSQYNESIQYHAKLINNNKCIHRLKGCEG